MKTSDVFDANADRAQVCALRFEQYGGVRTFSGEIATVRCFEEPGDGRVPVVDGGGSLNWPDSS